MAQRAVPPPIWSDDWLDQVGQCAAVDPLLAERLRGAVPRKPTAGERAVLDVLAGLSPLQFISAIEIERIHREHSGGGSTPGRVVVQALRKKGYWIVSARELSKRGRQVPPGAIGYRFDDEPVG